MMVFCLFSHKARAQYFNKLYQIDSTASSAGLVIPQTDGYLALVRLIDSTGLCFLKTDLDGNQLWVKKHYVSKEWMYLGVGKFYEELPGRELIFATSNNDSLFDALGYLFIVDSAFNVIWEKKIRHLDHTIFYSLTRDSSTGELIAVGGSRLDSETFPKLLIVKMDSSGQVKWMKQPINLCSAGIKLMINNAGEYLISGSFSYNCGLTAAPALFRTDSAGNLISFQPMGGSAKNGGADMFPLRNGDFLFTGFVDYNGGAVEDWQAYVARLNNNGAIIWDDTVNGQGNQVFNGAYELSDGTIMLYGMTDDPSRSTWLYHITATGDSIESRYLSSPSDFSNESYYMAPTPDKGFVLVGSDFSFQDGKQHSWMIKVDSLGCPAPGCAGVGFDDATHDPSSGFAIYPNPSSGDVTFSVDAVGTFKIRIFDQMGQRVYTSPAFTDLLKITSQNFVPGVYHVQLTNQGAVISTQKWVIVN